MSIGYDGPIPARPVVDCTGEKSPTVQAAKDECDINKIIARFERAGVWPGSREGYFADVSEVGEYRDALEVVRLADESFMTLDAKVRARFDNDPGKLVEFLSDPANEAEALELKLIEKVAPEGGAVAPGGSPAGPSA